MLVLQKGLKSVNPSDYASNMMQFTNIFTPSSSTATYLDMVGAFNTIENSTVQNNFIDINVQEKTIFEKIVKNRDNKSYNLFAHGKPGYLLINNQWLDAKEIVEFIKPKISNNITQLNIFGCEFALGKNGREAINYIEDKLNISVAASTNITGKDGDWILETSNNSSIDFTAQFSNYQYNLAWTLADTCRTCDFDGDGIINSLDLDDDNDGTLDAKESPSCFYTEKEVTKITNVTTQLISTANLANLYDTINNTYFNFTTNGQNVAGKEIFNWSYSYPINVCSFIFNMRNTYSFLYNTYVTLQGFNGTSWVNLSDSILYDNTAVGSLEVFGVTKNQGFYKQYRLFGNNGVVYSLGDIESITTNICDFIPEYYPKSTCTVAADNDGFPNHFDLDSDGDGCPDVYEAQVPGSTYNIDTIAGPYGVNGLANSIEIKDTATTSINYSSQYNVAAINSTINYCTDTDGDGIIDIFDIDDDNDGVLDIDEQTICNTNSTTDGKTNYEFWSYWQTTGWHDMVPISGVGGPYTLNVLPNVDQYGMPTNNLPPTLSGTVTSLNQPAGTDYTQRIDLVRWQGWIHFPSDLIGDSIIIRTNGVGIQLVGAGAWVISSDEHPENWIDPVAPATNTPLLDMNNTTGFYNPYQGWNQPPFGYTDYPFYEPTSTAQSPAGPGLSSINIPDPRDQPSAFQAKIKVNANGHYFSNWEVDPVNSWPAHSMEYSIDGGANWNPIQPTFYNSTPPCTYVDIDTDGDGIPNRLDLDSDNDGCFDSYESGSVKNANDSIVATPYNNNGYGAAVETNDSLNAKSNYPVTYYYAIQSNFSYCKDSDGDGIPDIIDIDDDNDGIFDAVESPNCYYTIHELSIGNRTSVLNVYSDFSTASPYTIDKSIDGIYTTASNTRFDVNAQNIENKTIYQVQFPVPVELSGITFKYSSINSVLSTSKLRLQGSSNFYDWRDLSNSVTYTANPASLSHTFNVTKNVGKYSYYRLVGDSGVTSSSGYFEAEFNLPSSFGSSTYQKPNCSLDIDGDGIPNQLDLDSDGDGCPDATDHF